MMEREQNIVIIIKKEGKNDKRPLSIRQSQNSVRQNRRVHDAKAGCNFQKTVIRKTDRKNDFFSTNYKKSIDFFVRAWYNSLR